MSVSGSWVSLPIIINRCVLERGKGGGFSDEAPSTVNKTLSAALAQPVTVETTPVQPAPAPESSTEAASDTDVTAFLGNL
jgi:hypothetical protein